MQIDGKNSPESVFDTHFSITCPHCNAYSNVTAVSIPRYEYLKRFRPAKVGVAYRCDACNYPIFGRFRVKRIDTSPIQISDAFEEVEKAQETFEFEYLPEVVAEDFREALTCYSNLCYNAFSAMCRRTCQSAFSELGAEGKSKVSKQLREVKDTIDLDDETYDIFEQIILSGHDGSHPNLPRVTENRAFILLELMKDVLYQLFVRQAKVNEAVELRNREIEKQKTPED